MDSTNARSPAHLTCPKCHYEFEFDHVRYDNDIARLGKEIRDIMDQFARNKASMGEWSPQYKDWAAKAARAMRIKQNQIAELKQFRKVANEQAQQTKLQIFAQIVREHVPFEQYVAWHEQAEKMVCYRTYDVAVQRHNNFAGA